MVTKKIPYSQYEGEFVIYQIFNAIAAKFLPEKPEHLHPTKDQLWEKVCKACWQFDPENRLTVEEAVRRLKALKAGVEIEFASPESPLGCICQ